MGVKEKHWPKTTNPDTKPVRRTGKDLWRHMPPEQSTILVTGATGFLASHIIKCLLKKKYRVRGTVRPSSSKSKIAQLELLFPGIQIAEADLLCDHGWKEAVEGCDAVIHVASPVPVKPPRDPDDLIIPAVQGTLRVLAACEGVVRRVVLTSSSAAIGGDYNDKPDLGFYTEDDWTDVSSPYLGAYGRGKTLAERAAWDFVSRRPGSFDLVVINPTVVLGPQLMAPVAPSVEIIKLLLDGRNPLYPNLNFPLCDVRDAAEAHVQALVEPAAIGCRHIIAAKNMWFGEIADVLRGVFAPQGYSVPSLSAPYPVLWVASWWNENIRLILGWVGKVKRFSNARMRIILGIEPRDVTDSILDTAYSLIELGLINSKL